MNYLYDSTPISGLENGAVEQTIIYNVNNFLFKIEIVSHPDILLSTASLSLLNKHNEFTLLIKRNTNRDYKIDVCYRDEPCENDVFQIIVTNMYQYSQHFIKFLN